MPKLAIQSLFLPRAWCRAIGASASPARATPPIAHRTRRSGRAASNSQTASIASGKKAK